MILNNASYKTFQHTGVNGREFDFFEKFPFKNEFQGVSYEILQRAIFGENILIESGKETEHNLKDFRGTLDIISRKGENTKAIFTLDGGSNAFFRVIARENSELKLIIFEKGEAFKSIAIEAYDSAKVEVLIFELGNNFQATSLECDLLGRKSSAKIKGIYFGEENSDMDFSYHIRHFGEESESDILLNGALSGNAKKLVKSNLDFMYGAKGAVGDEEENTILLSDDVVNKSVPILLSHEDDVEGNHAASSGKIDENIKFYLKTRGLSEEEAQTLILMARFESTISESDNEELKEEIRKLIMEKLR